MPRAQWLRVGLVQEGSIPVVAESSAGWHCSTQVLSQAICGEEPGSFPFQFYFQSIPYGHFCKI